MFSKQRVRLGMRRIKRNTHSNRARQKKQWFARYVNGFACFYSCICMYICSFCLFSDVSIECLRFIFVLSFSVIVIIIIISPFCWFTPFLVWLWSELKQEINSDSLSQSTLDSLCRQSAYIGVWCPRVSAKVHVSNACVCKQCEHKWMCKRTKGKSKH